MDRPRWLPAVGGTVAVIAALWLGLQGYQAMFAAPAQIRVLPLETDIRVSVRGAVAAPGVYRLTDGDRVEDAIRAAGGATTDANLDAVNLAARVRDEQSIVVPRVGETIAPIVATAPAGTATVTAPVGTAPATPTRPARARLNLNTASETELIAIPGIAELTARRILQSRQQAPFTSVEELLTRQIMNRENYDRAKELLAVQ